MCVCNQDPVRRTSAHGWILGHTALEDIPRCLWQFALQHTLSSACEYIKLNPNAGPQFIDIKAGDHTAGDKMCRWFNDGVLDLQPATASDIVDVTGELTRITRCPLICDRAESGRNITVVCHRMLMSLRRRLLPQEGGLKNLLLGRFRQANRL